MHLLLVLTSVAAVAAFKDPHYAPGHDGMVHLFEWTWQDIAVECETFLGPKGFGGVQVSPVQENVVVPGRPWWERYQPVSYKWETRSGTTDDFRDMVRRCNAAGVRIFVDIVLNHMSADQEFKVVGTGNSTANPPTRQYPAVPYNWKHFHVSCPIRDYNDPVQVRNCELVGLHDLDQSIEYVRSKLVGFMNELIDAGVAGFRIDAAKHMWPTDLKAIYSRLTTLNTSHGFAPNARPYIYQEVIDMGGEGISKKEYNILGAVTEFTYGTEITSSLRGYNPLKWFHNIGEDWAMLPNRDALIFIDNHDNQRSSDNPVLTHKQPRLYKMALAFMLAHPYGTPQIISSFEFDTSDQGPPADAEGNLQSPFGPGRLQPTGCKQGWVCEHRWRQIYNMIGFRNVVNGTDINSWWDNCNNQIAFSRGNLGFIAINADRTDLHKQIKTQLPPGKYCDVISGEIKNHSCTGRTVVVNVNGEADVRIPLNAEDGVLAIHVGARL